MKPILVLIFAFTVFNALAQKENIPTTENFDGKPATSLDNRIALVSPNDQMTGRRYVKGLQKIVVERIK